MSGWKQGCLSASLALAVLVCSAQAQQKDPRLNPPVTPLPPVPSGESSSKTADRGPAAAAPVADTRPLSGVEELTLGSAGGWRSYLVGGFKVSHSYDTNSGAGTVARRRGGATLASAQLALQRQRANSEMVFQYSTGGLVYNNTQRSNAFPQQMAFSYSRTLRRWSLLLSDQFSFLPESAFGFSGGFGGGRGSIAAVPLHPGLVPSQTILTAVADRVSNSVVGQASYVLNGRSSLTASASYGLLRFLESEFVESDSLTAQAGYDRKLSAADTLAVTYGFRHFVFRGTDGGLDNHTVQLSYGRRLTGRLALRLSAGPQYVRNKLATAGARSDTTWQVGSALSWNYGSGNIDLSFNRNLSSGSGVFRGSQTQVVQMGLARQLSRQWNGSLQFGYSHNEALAGSVVTTSRNFHAWHAGVGLGRPVGRYSHVSLHYGLRWQSAAACAGAACQGRVLRHVVGLNFDFSFRPIRLE